MIGISSSGKENINKIVENMFDRIALSFLGNIPRLQNKKLIVFNTSTNFGLPHLFVQAMQNKPLNAIEHDVLKSLLVSADGYIESLKNKTKSNVAERLDGITREAKIKKDKVSAKDVDKVLQEEMGKAKTHLQAIIESESTKFRNLGTLMDITRVSSSLNDEDPTVFFIIVKDGNTCKECIRLHTVDGTTPKLWKFSELKQGYHKRGEENPSAFGLHPHCRCTLTYLSKGFGFDKEGKVHYKSDMFDAFISQRNK